MRRLGLGEVGLLRVRHEKSSKGQLMWCGDWSGRMLMRVDGIGRASRQSVLGRSRSIEAGLVRVTVGAGFATLMGFGVACRSNAQGGNCDWSMGQRSHGFLSETYCAESWDRDGQGPEGPTMVVGGMFTYAGGQPANRVAYWDEALGGWSAIGDPTLGGGVNGSVRAILAMPNGHLIVGGDFTQAGSVGTQRVATWNGTKWTPFGTGLSGGTQPSVRALASMDNGDVVAGGQFTMAGGAPASNIARWDGSSWTALSSATAGRINTLLSVAGGDLIAGGAFTAIGGVTAPWLARWDGLTWLPVGEGAWGSGVNGEVHAMCVLPNGDLCVAGAFLSAGGAQANRIATWNGSAWSLLGTGLSGPAFSLAVAPSGNLVVGGNFAQAGGTSALDIAQWDGSAWQAMPGLTQPTSVNALLAMPNQLLYAFGNLPSQKHVASWDGLGWLRVTRDVDERIRDLHRASNGDIVVVGPFASAGGQRARGIARWDGQNWHGFGSGFSYATSGAVPSGRAIAEDTNGDLIVGGDFDVAGGVSASYIARWNGTAWSPLGDGVGGYVHEVIRHTNGDFFVGGVFTKSGSQRVARWSGQQWWPLGAGLDGTVRVLAEAPNGDVYAGGDFFQSGTLKVGGVAKWNGAVWSPIDPVKLAPGQIWSLTFDSQGGLYVGGIFTVVINGSTTHNILRWDGTDWSGLSSGVYAAGIDLSVRSIIELSTGDIVAAGVFGAAGTPPVFTSCIARWNGAAWSSFGAGLTGGGAGGVAPYVNDLLLLPDGTIMAGGQFSKAEALASESLARLVCPPLPPCVADCDQSGDLTIDDFICYQTLYAIGNPTADCDQSGDLTIDDFICFQTLYAIGC